MIATALIVLNRKRKKSVEMKERRMDVIIPTYRPGKEFAELLEKLQAQTVVPQRIILMNTEEELLRPFLEEYYILERYSNLEIHHVKKADFDHGRTRHQGVQYSDAPYFLCMTQDALPADDKLIEELLQGLEQESVAAVYARQLPRPDCSLLEKYTRSFNYPGESRVKTRNDLQELGIKTYFCSNVCAAYNREIYDRCGGFIQRTIFNEDMIYAAKAVKRGYGIAYEAGARVVHSHNYSGKQQFHRNFDLGVSQADHPDIFREVPSEKEGSKMVKQILTRLCKEGKFFHAVNYIYQSGCKFMGYQLGKRYRCLPLFLRKVFSMEKNYWNF